MASTRSRLRKLLKTPDVFFRDMLLKQFPGMADRLLTSSENADFSESGESAAISVLPSEIGLCLQGIPILRMVRGLHFPLHGIPAYAAGTVADRLASLAGVLIAIDGSAPSAASTLRHRRLRKAFTQAKQFSLYAEINGMLQILPFSIWDVTGDFLTARPDDLPLKRTPVSTLWSGQDIIPAGSFPDCRTPNGPIDAVYTWVNSGDPHWQSLFQSAGGAMEINQDRFGQADELRYSLRSLFMHAPWINNVFILSNCSPPDWFSPCPNVHWVDHGEVIPKAYLPLFNSNAIESFLWHIDGLSEQFIYLNDDFFLGRYFNPSAFFLGNGYSISRLHERALVPSMLANSILQSEDWEAATVTAAKHFHARYGVFPGELHEHAPYTVRRSVAALMENDFPDAFAALRSNRFRDDSDVPPISFLYPHYARWNRFSQNVPSQSALISQDNFNHILDDLRVGLRKDFYCINDGGNSSQNAAFQGFKTEFGELMYPFASPCERGSDKASVS